MNSRKLTIMGIFLTAGALLAPSLVTAEKPQADFDPVTAASLEELVPSGLTRVAALEKARQDRKNDIFGLLLLIDHLKQNRDQHLPDSRFYVAIEMLGLLRAEQATVPLMDLIDIRFYRVATGPRAPRDPEVIQALARIGKPASKAAIGYLAKDKSSKRAAMYLRVIYLVEGPEVGRFMLEQATKKESDPERKKRLERALVMFADANKVCLERTPR